MKRQKADNDNDDVAVVDTAHQRTTRKTYNKNDDNDGDDNDDNNNQHKTPRDVDATIGMIRAADVYPADGSDYAYDAGGGANDDDVRNRDNDNNHRDTGCDADRTLSSVAAAHMTSPASNDADTVTSSVSARPGAYAIGGSHDDTTIVLGDESVATQERRQDRYQQAMALQRQLLEGTFSAELVVPVTRPNEGENIGRHDSILVGQVISEEEVPSPSRSSLEQRWIFRDSRKLQCLIVGSLLLITMLVIISTNLVTNYPKTRW